MALCGSKCGNESNAIHYINNPAENLKPQEKVEVVRFVVPVKKWKDKKQEVWRK